MLNNGILLLCWYFFIGTRAFNHLFNKDVEGNHDYNRNHGTNQTFVITPKEGIPTKGVNERSRRHSHGYHCQVMPAVDIETGPRVVDQDTRNDGEHEANRKPNEG